MNNSWRWSRYFGSFASRREKKRGRAGTGPWNDPCAISRNFASIYIRRNRLDFFWKLAFIFYIVVNKFRSGRYASNADRTRPWNSTLESVGSSFFSYFENTQTLDKAGSYSSGLIYISEVDIYSTYNDSYKMISVVESEGGAENLPEICSSPGPSVRCPSLGLI